MKRQLRTSEGRNLHEYSPPADCAKTNRGPHHCCRWRCVSFSGDRQGNEWQVRPVGSYRASWRRTTPHVHSREEEGFYVLEGEITLQIGDQRLVATAGMFANMPVGTPHSFKNESDKPARMLISVAPAGLEEMFFEIGVPVPQGATSAPPPKKEEIEKLLQIAPRYGIEILLPKH